MAEEKRFRIRGEKLLKQIAEYAELLSLKEFGDSKTMGENQAVMRALNAFFGTEIPRLRSQVGLDPSAPIENNHKHTMEPFPDSFEEEEDGGRQFHEEEEVVGQPSGHHPAKSVAEVLKGLDLEDFE